MFVSILDLLAAMLVPCAQRIVSADDRASETEPIIKKPGGYRIGIAPGVCVLLCFLFPSPDRDSPLIPVGRFAVQAAASYSTKV